MVSPVGRHQVANAAPLPLPGGPVPWQILLSIATLSCYDTRKMATEDQYREMIRGMDHGALVELWSQVKMRDTPEWEPGRAFEYLVLRAFEIEGAEVRYPFQVPYHGEVVEQIDGVIYADGVSAVVESKDHKDPVNVEPLAKLRNQLLRRPAATIGVLFSYSGFTDPALVLAQFLSPQTILLWDGDEIERALNEKAMIRGLRLKQQYAVERGLPDFNLLTAGVL